MPRPLRALPIVLRLIAGVAFVWLLLDYVYARSDAKFVLTLSRFGPDTPLESYISEFGNPTHHFTDPDQMQDWGPRKDDALLVKTELYYFTYGGIPFRSLVIYVDRETHRSVIVSWKYD
jgi:hypothetical protein